MLNPVGILDGNVSIELFTTQRATENSGFQLAMEGSSLKQ